MPLTTETLDLEATLDRKLDELDGVAQQAGKLDPQNPALADLNERGATLDTHVNALEWAIDNWDVGEITVTGMTGGEAAEMQNDLEKNAEGSGDSRIATVVYGTEDAPYISHDDDGNLDKAATYAAVGQLPFDVQRWIEDEVNERTEVGNPDTRTYAQRVREMRHRQDGTENSESDGS